MLELIIVEVEITPFITELITFIADASELEFMILALVEVDTPFTLEVKVNEFVLVDIFKTLEDIKVVVAITPFTFVVKIFPVTD